MHAPPPTGTTGTAPPPVVGPLGRGEGVEAMEAVAAPLDGTAFATSPNPSAKANAIAVVPKPNRTRWPCPTWRCISLLSPAVDRILH